MLECKMCDCSDIYGNIILLTQTLASDRISEPYFLKVSDIQKSTLRLNLSYKMLGYLFF